MKFENLKSISMAAIATIATTAHARYLPPWEDTPLQHFRNMLEDPLVIKVAIIVFATIFITRVFTGDDHSELTKNILNILLVLILILLSGSFASMLFG